MGKSIEKSKRSVVYCCWYLPDYECLGGYNMPENMQNVFDVAEEWIFRTTLTARKSGFHRICVRYAHSNWDAWLKMDIVGETSDTVSYIPPLPNKYTETTMLVYLFEGENKISMAPRFDQPVRIDEIVVVDDAPVLKPYATPSQDRFYLAEPLDRRVVVVSYTGAPIKITEGDKEIAFELEDKALYDHASPVETLEPHYYYHLRLQSDVLSALGEGRHDLTIHLPEEQSVSYTLIAEKNRQEYDFQIVSLDVNHGNCVLLRLPNGKNLLIDTGVKTCAQNVIFPYLDSQGIGVDYLIISHYDGDHMGCLEEVLQKYPLVKADEEEMKRYLDLSRRNERYQYLAGTQYLDNKTFCRYDRLDEIWDLGGVQITVLNSKYEANGAESMPGVRNENETSVSMLVSYNGFQYYHGADNHAPNQRRNLADFTEAGRLDELECHYMQANHHFHGDMYPEMIRAINPIAVVVPAHQAIYSRSAFMVDYQQDVVATDYKNKRLKETFVSYMSGTVTALVNSSDDWHYETL